MSEQFPPGRIIEVPHPFIRVEAHPIEGWEWCPGTRQKDCVTDDFCAVADDMGHQILTIISTYKPGSFPERVFFTRKWRDPNGTEFGKNNLHMKSTVAFRTLVRGYQHHFDLQSPINSKGEG